MIYLDNNATTAIDPRVLELMRDVWFSGPLNASSQHASGRAARNRLDESISLMSGLLGGDVDSPGGGRLILTSGGTESNNLALSGIGDPQGRLVISAIEHPSVLEVARGQAASGRDVNVIPVDESGVIDREVASRLINASPRPALVSVMAANNETGVVQPIEWLGQLCQSAGVPLHCDATQAIGKLAFRGDLPGLSAVTATAHKFHGPAGIGLLMVRAGVDLRPQMVGGEQQLAHRAGTEPVALAAGMAEALRLAECSIDQHAGLMSRCRDRFESALMAVFPELTIHGHTVARLPGTSCISFPAADRQAMLMALDLAGIACSSGSACASGSSRPSHVLSAMGVGGAQIATALRFGFSRFSTFAEVDQAVDAISRSYKRLRDHQVVEKRG